MGDLVEIGPGSKADLSVNLARDMAQGGGGEMGPSAKFFPDIQMDFDSKGCTALACHGTSGNGSVMFVKMGATLQADIDANYTHVMNDVNTTSPSQSPILTKNLPGATHGGGVHFSSTSDATYVKWLNWISAGAPKQ